MTRRYILSVREEACMQYEVEAESEAEVRAIYERGEIGNPGLPLTSHYEAEIVSIHEMRSA